MKAKAMRAPTGPAEERAEDVPRKRPVPIVPPGKKCESFAVMIHERLVGCLPMAMNCRCRAWRVLLRPESEAASDSALTTSAGGPLSSPELSLGVTAFSLNMLGDV
jgi:hypothetical protein